MLLQSGLVDRDLLGFSPLRRSATNFSNIIVHFEKFQQDGVRELIMLIM